MILLHWFFIKFRIVSVLDTGEMRLLLSDSECEFKKMKPVKFILFVLLFKKINILLNTSKSGVTLSYSCQNGFLSDFPVIRIVRHFKRENL